MSEKLSAPDIKRQVKAMSDALEACGCEVAASCVEEDGTICVVTKNAEPEPPEAMLPEHAGAYLGVTEGTFLQLVMEDQLPYPKAETPGVWMRADLDHIETTRRPMWLYFIATADERFVKIGVAANVDQRIAGLQTANPEPLKLLGKMRGSRWLEQLFHWSLRDYRMTGEWFRHSPWINRVLVRANTMCAHDVVKWLDAQLVSKGE